MLGIFKEKLVKAPKELNNPASLNSCTKPKPSHEILKDFMPCNSSNAFSMCFGNDALLAYSPSNKPSIHHRLFSGLDNIYCVFLGGLHSLSMVNKQYGLSKGTNKAMFITEAYQTLRDRGPYPADQVLKELEGSLGFVIYDNKDGTIFVAFGSNGQIGLYWGVVAYSSIVIYENMELIKASCAKSLAPFPTVFPFSQKPKAVSESHEDSTNKGFNLFSISLTFGNSIGAVGGITEGISGNL
ncbi:hypothetical protein AAZX31_04G164300 [Glycine max]